MTSTSQTDPPLISVIVPAFNAATTLDETLASLTRQVFGDWEAIVVDDGSADATLRVAAAWAARDLRIRVIAAPHGGVGAARNRGMAEARGDWIQFLDADDALEPRHLAQMSQAIRSHPQADVLFCGWRVVSSGAEGPEQHPPDLTQAFAVTARRAPFAIHSALTRRSAVEAAGQFDPDLPAAEDWDFWQRVARTGAKFAPVEGLYARYALRPGSAAHNLGNVLVCGLEVIRRGHAPDPRVHLPDPRHAAGADPGELSVYLAVHAIWVMGAALGLGKPRKVMAQVLKVAAGQEPSPQVVAECLIDGIARTTDAHAHAWLDIWPRVQRDTLRFLAALERRTGAPALARRTLRRIELLLADQLKPGEAGQIGGLLVTRIDLDQPLEEILLPRGVERVRCLIEREGVASGRFDVLADERLTQARMAPILEEEHGQAPAFAPVLEGRALWFERLKLNLPFRRRSAGPQRPRQDTANPAPRSSDDYWEKIFSEPDPWKYDNPYERLKYDQTLAAIPRRAFARGLELACAEGHFTVDLAGRVEQLLATDISATALDRAQARCAHLTNVEFHQLDLANDAIPGLFDLIVCSEVLYYLRDRESLQAFANRIGQSLSDDGILISAHANVQTEDPQESGFRWPHSFGAKGIGEAFAAAPDLEFTSEFRTELYRIQVFTKSAAPAHRGPRISHGSYSSDLPSEVAAMVGWKVPVASAAAHAGLPILAYHRVACDGPEALRPFRISPEDFEAQIAWLHAHGYTGITLDEFEAAVWEGAALPDKPVLITFDDGYRDVFVNALPILRRYGFPATIFLVSDKVGGRADWDVRFGPPAELLDWPEIEAMAAEGISFGAHGARHQPLTALTATQLSSELERSRTAIAGRLGRCVTLAYPYGEFDEAIGRAAYEHGYRLGFSCEPKLWRPGSQGLTLPRLTVLGDQSLDVFIAQISGA